VENIPVSVRTYDPKEPEIYKQGACSSSGCGLDYFSICKLCNLAYCFQHLKNQPHVCNTGREFLVLSEDEVLDIFGPKVEPL
jgi:hypothetical protein